jgi:ubiquitin fusion degradation protein 1
MYNNKVYEMSVLETKPAAAVSVIECDLNVDFAPPVGYKEPEFKKKAEEQEDQVRY